MSFGYAYNIHANDNKHHIIKIDYHSIQFTLDYYMYVKYFSYIALINAFIIQFFLPKKRNK